MTETQKRIRAYKKALPDLRERVIAVALLLAMSASMLTSASFAWLTISRRPEVTGVNTTVAANGNLEIALAQGDGRTAPGESLVGDSSAREGQSVAAANLTWGNLVNLSDPSYGLDSLTLRPAQLNKSSLLVSPLYGAVYEKDGRVSKLNSSFAYSTWDAEHGLFVVSDQVGVRAISSTTVKAVGHAENVLKKRNAAEEANLAAGSAYLAITNNKSYMDSLAVIMGKYMTANINQGQNDESLKNPSMDQKDIQNLTYIFRDCIEAYDKQFEAMTKLVNYQLYLKNNKEGQAPTPYTEYTVEQIRNTTEAALRQNGFQATGLNDLKTYYEKLQRGYAQMLLLRDKGEVKWADSGLNSIVNNLMDVSTCYLDNTRIGTIGASNAMQYLDGKTHDAKITNGVLFEFEKINGSQCRVENLEITATAQRTVLGLPVTVPATVKANIYTTVTMPFSFPTDLTESDKLNQGGAGVQVAQDTYGLALDMWVRTNASGSYLTLEGNLLTKTDLVDATCLDANGNTVPLYTLARTADGETYTLDLYKVESDGTTVWYNANTHEQVTLDSGEKPTRKKEEVITVVGYEGENRIWSEEEPWDENANLSLDSTSQGSGSCYVYYADTPEDQARSLDLLKAMNVAFVDDKGALMATARMDTDHFYAENGRVTVPLVLRSDSPQAGTTTSGETIYAITALEKNVPKRITAIVYLDGTLLTNEDVLAAADIQGKLNIQFGSSADMEHMEDEKLLTATRSVSATVSKDTFKYDESIANGTRMTTQVKLTVNGDAPTKITAFFLRAISSTQGSREGVMNFTKQADGTWVSDYTFTMPGNYILRSVELDGQNYDLSDYPKVTVEGFSIVSLSSPQATGRHLNFMTADASCSADVELKFASSNPNAMPTSVQGRFLRDDDGTAVNINFSYDPTSSLWKGKATFLSSGNYTLQYLVLNGEYAELDSSLWHTASVKLGMKAAVYTESPVSFKYDPQSMLPNQINLKMKVKILDNTGEEMLGLNDLHLYYSKDGSMTDGMNTPLAWNATSGYYEGTFLSKIGVFSFSQVTVGTNTVKYASTSPTFTIMPPNPIDFGEGNTIPLQYAPSGNGAVLMAVLTNSDAATVVAEVTHTNKDGKVETYTLTGARKDGGQWEFPINLDKEDYDYEGVWTMTSLAAWNVYDDDGTFRPESNPLRISLSGKSGVSTTVISEVSAAFSADSTLEYTGNGFLEPYTVKNLQVKFSNNFNVEMTNTMVTSAKLTLTRQKGTSAEHGGYTSAQLDEGIQQVAIDLQYDSVKNSFVPKSGATLTYAGVYDAELSYSVQNTTGTSITLAPVTVKTTTTVAITKISPTGKISVDKDGSLGSGHTDNFEVAAVTSGPEATVYFKCETKKSWGVTYHQYKTIPSVEITVTGRGKATSAKLDFTTDADELHIYNGTTQTTGYAWDWTNNTTDNTCERKIGTTYKLINSYYKVPAQNLTAKQLILTDAAGNQYTFDLPESDWIKIHNPY